MEMVLQILILVLGFVCLVKGSDWFVDGAAGIATKFGIPQLIIGLTIVAMGTSAPEAAVSITAAFNGSADITIGNIIGRLSLQIPSLYDEIETINEKGACYSNCLCNVTYRLWWSYRACS